MCYRWATPLSHGEIQCGNVKSLCDASFPYCVCVFSLMEAFSKVSLIDLFIWLTEVLGAVEAMVMIHLDFKGNMVALLLG